MGKYTYQDISSIFDYAQKNPDKKLKDWIDILSRTISPEESDQYRGVEYSAFNMQSKSENYTFYIFKSHTPSLMEKLITKFIGNKEYYSYIPGDFYGYHYKIVCFDEIYSSINDWNNYMDYKDVKFIDNLGIKIIYNGLDGSDEYMYERFGNHLSKIKKKSSWFWESNNFTKIIIENIDAFDFIPIDNLFEDKKIFNRDSLINDIIEK